MCDVSECLLLAWVRCVRDHSFAVIACQHVYTMTMMMMSDMAQSLSMMAVTCYRFDVCVECVVMALVWLAVAYMMLMILVMVLNDMVRFSLSMMAVRVVSI
jgi:hypothetical protein